MREIVVMGLLCVVCGVYTDTVDGRESARQRRKSAVRESQASRAETDYADLKEGVYQLPFGVGVREVANWSKSKNLLVDGMPTAEKYKKEIVFHIQNIKPLSDLEGWDPNSDWPLSKLEELDLRLSKLPSLPRSEFNQVERELLWAASIRDGINALKNPCYVEENKRYPLKPVFQLDSLRRSHIPLYWKMVKADAGLRFLDDRLLRRTAVVHLRRPHSLEDIDPLSVVSVYFIQIGKDEWKSFATMATLFSAQFNSQRKEIISALNEKYGRVRAPTPIPEEVVTMYHCITGNEVEVFTDDPPSLICLKWKNNIFAFTDPPLEKAQPLVLLYYEANYAAELIQTRAAALVDIQRQYDEQEKESLKQLKGNF